MDLEVGDKVEYKSVDVYMFGTGTIVELLSNGCFVVEIDKPMRFFRKIKRLVFFKRELKYIGQPKG